MSAIGKADVERPGGGIQARAFARPPSLPLAFVKTVEKKFGEVITMFEVLAFCVIAWPVGQFFGRVLSDVFDRLASDAENKSLEL